MAGGFAELVVVDDPGHAARDINKLNLIYFSLLFFHLFRPGTQLTKIQVSKN